MNWKLANIIALWLLGIFVTTLIPAIIGVLNQLQSATQLKPNHSEIAVMVVWAIYCFTKYFKNNENHDA